MFFGFARVLARASGLDEQRCPACLHPYSIQSHRDFLCQSCLSDLHAGEQKFCPRCGMPVAQAVGSFSPGQAGCLSCLNTPPPWLALYAVGPYQGLLRQLLHKAKFSADRSASRVLGHLLSLACENLPPVDAIVPMPLHPDRLRQRGFNQCYEIGRVLAAEHAVPLAPLVERIRPTGSQTGLGRRDRLRNLRGAFRARPGVQGKTLLLIDDTMTTGTSLRRMADCLLKAGACTVHAAVVAVTLPYTSKAHE